MCRPFPYVNAYFLFSSYMPVAGGDGVQVALILRASSCALGFVRRPPSHLGARCTLIFGVHGHSYFPRALSPRWGSLQDMAHEGSGNVGSNGRRILRIILNEVKHCCRSRPRLGLGKLWHFYFLLVIRCEIPQDAPYRIGWGLGGLPHFI